MIKLVACNYIIDIYFYTLTYSNVNTSQTLSLQIITYSKTEFYFTLFTFLL